MSGKDRKKELARQRYERQLERRAAQDAQARRAKVIGGAVATAVVLLGGTGLVVALNSGDDDKNDVAAASDSPSAEPTAAPTSAKAAKPGECLYGASPEKASKDVGKPPVKPAHKGAVEATIKTNLGDIEVELDGKKAPCTTNSFTYLASKDYFNKTSCHRLTENVLQCGDPSATGSGGPGYQFGTENTKGAKYKKAVLAMARTTDPNSNGSQFFIVYKDWDDLDPDYTIFGKVTGGLDIVESVGKAGFETDPETQNTAPKKKVEIDSVSVAKK